MKKPLWIAIFMVVTAGWLLAQPWIYDFGNTTGSYTISSVSTSFLPSPPSGIARVRIGEYGGGFYLQNPGLQSLGASTELRMVAPTATSANKFSVYNYSAGKTSYTQFDILLGNASGGNADSGTFYFTSGDGSMYYDNNAFNQAHVFSGLKWVYGSSGSVTTTYRNGSDWTSLGTNLFTQGNIYKVEIYGNNSISSSTYGRGGIIYSVAANKQDIWVNGSLVGEGLNKAGLADDSMIDSFLFYSLSSTKSVANCFLDNIIYSNSLPSYPTEQASNISFLDTQTDRLTLQWENGNGSKRVVMINTENSFVTPPDGSDPDGNSVYNSREQQVVYNGTGESVTISGLNPDTVYWFKIFEVNGTGIATRYNADISITNPLSQKTTEETLPVELSNFYGAVNIQNDVNLCWVTQSETGVIGFCVYRGDSAELADAIQISPLIAGTNTSQLHSYLFTDSELVNSGNYYYWLQIQEFDGSSFVYEPISVYYTKNDFVTDVPEIYPNTGIKEIYPNPFNPQTTICYEIEQAATASVYIYNLRGQMVKSFSSNHTIPGSYKVIWNGKDENSKECASGVYQVLMVSGKFKSVRKLVLSK
ncbi:hypothetical protein MASR2M64_12790 [Candidatus Cloacimonadota bacterium]|nr:T9SS type A sorting domain-containing protein [Candidatus Cloacimonadota bacterium]